MSLNPNLTQTEAKWLVTEFAPVKDGMISGETMDKYFLPARRLMTGKPGINKPSCGCEFKVFGQITASMYNQYESEIKVVATPKTRKTRGKTQ